MILSHSCTHSEKKTRTITFKDNTNHIQEYCINCSYKKFISKKEKKQNSKGQLTVTREDLAIVKEILFHLDKALEKTHLLQTPGAIKEVIGPIDWTYNLVNNSFDKKDILL